MPEALTESFCERCGTRYEFQSPTQLSPLRKTRGLVSGLRNYIMSQDALGDAIGDAMRSEEETLASRQLEAFHDTFSFCIGCRQYACTNCWNVDAGRCRSCAPIPGKDDLVDQLEAAYLADHQAMHAAESELAVDEISRRLGVESWPQTDLVAEGTGTPLETRPAPEPEPVTAEEPAPPEIVGPSPMQVLAWEEDAEIELRRPIEETLPDLEVAWSAEIPPEPVVAEEPAPPEVVPAPPLVPEPVVAEEPAPPEVRPIRPIAETILHLPPRRSEQPVEIDPEALAARRAQLDLLGLEDPGVGAVTPGRPGVLPYRSSGAAVHPAELAQRTVGSTSALWDASAREVTGLGSAIAVQGCGACGLSLSSSARFCRRCGTRQARSA
jgi:hypothetical protein